MVPYISILIKSNAAQNMTQAERDSVAHFLPSSSRRASLPDTALYSSSLLYGFIGRTHNARFYPRVDNARPLIYSRALRNLRNLKGKKLITVQSVGGGPTVVVIHSLNAAQRLDAGLWLSTRPGGPMLCQAGQICLPCCLLSQRPA